MAFRPNNQEATVLALLAIVIGMRLIMSKRLSSAWNVLTTNPPSSGEGTGVQSNPATIGFIGPLSPAATGTQYSGSGEGPGLQGGNIPPGFNGPIQPKQP